MTTAVEMNNYGGLLAAFVLGFIAVWNANKARKTANAAKEQGEAIHALVNGGRTQDLTNLVKLTKRLSEISPTAEDKAAYTQALQNLKIHQDSITPPLTTADDSPTTPP